MTQLLLWSLFYQVGDKLNITSIYYYISCIFQGLIQTVFGGILNVFISVLPM